MVCTRNYIPRPPFEVTCDCPYCTRAQQQAEEADDER